MLLQKGHSICARRSVSQGVKRQLRVMSSSAKAPSGSTRPTILFDIMDTVVFDPFFTEMPKFFGLTFEELLKAKHPTAWVEFEKALIDEEELCARFFADGRSFDRDGLRQTMVQSYRYLDGMEPLLARLRDSGYELHAMSNYPAWYRLIEDKLQVSRFMPWTFISCDGPMQGLRKPDREAYEVAVERLGRPAGELIFVDDRKVNVEAASAVGIQGVLFKGAQGLEQELVARGLRF